MDTFPTTQLRVDTYTCRDDPETTQKESHQIVYGYHSSIPAWRIPWTKKQVGYSPSGHKDSNTTEAT